MSYDEMKADRDRYYECFTQTSAQLKKAREWVDTYEYVMVTQEAWNELRSILKHKNRRDMV